MAPASYAEQNVNVLPATTREADEERENESAPPLPEDMVDLQLLNVEPEIRMEAGMGCGRERTDPLPEGREKFSKEHSDKLREMKPDGFEAKRMRDEEIVTLDAGWIDTSDRVRFPFEREKMENCRDKEVTVREIVSKLT